MPLTRKGAKILEAMRQQYGGKKGTPVFYASANKGTISGVHQGHHVPVTNSPHHPLRPPGPESAAPDPRDYIPEGRREVTASAAPGHGAGIFAPVGGASTVATHQAHSTVGHPALRPPTPEGANPSGFYDWIPPGRRGVLRHPSLMRGPHATLAHMDRASAAHQQLAHEVASGLRKFTFGQVARQQPAQL